MDPIDEPIHLDAAVADAHLELRPQRGQATLNLVEAQAVDPVGLKTADLPAHDPRPCAELALREVRALTEHAMHASYAPIDHAASVGIASYRPLGAPLFRHLYRLVNLTRPGHRRRLSVRVLTTLGDVAGPPRCASGAA
jgi:hypothetical protein